MTDSTIGQWIDTFQSLPLKRVVRSCLGSHALRLAGPGRSGVSPGHFYSVEAALATTPPRYGARLATNSRIETRSLT